MKQLLRLPAVILILSLTILSLAQNPDIPREWLEDRLQLEGDRITFCLNPDALTASFDRALAQELAGVLLLEPRIHEVETWRPTPPLDYRLPLNQNQTFMLLADHCNAFINFSISPHTPEWMILTRPYYRSGFSFISTHPEVTSLQDLEPGERVGTRSQTAADISFATFIQSLDDGNRWSRAPYPDNALLLERLLDGTIRAAMIWDPALYVATDGDPESQGIRVISAGAYQPPATEFGLALRNQDAFLRTMLDEAIQYLIQDGTIESLLAQYGIRGTPAGTGR